jgi:hypothetical protein
VRTICPDQILAGEWALATALDIFGEDGDAFLLLLDIDDLDQGVKEVMISQQVVEGTAGPLYMYTGGARAI